MSEGTVIPFPRGPTREPSNDTAALNDIHALAHLAVRRQ